MPCSPLIEPSSATHLRTTPSRRLVARAMAAPSAGSTMMLTWMLPSPAWPNDGMRQLMSVAQPLDQREELRDSTARHDDVVVQLQRCDRAERIGGLAADAPERLALRRHRARGAPRAHQTRDTRRRPDPLRPRSPPPRRRLPRAAARRSPRAPAARRRKRRQHRATRDPSARSSPARRADESGRHRVAPPRARSAKQARSVATSGGFGTRRRMISVMIASVPSDPTSSCVRS